MQLMKEQNHLLKHVQESNGKKIGNLTTLWVSGAGQYTKKSYGDLTPFLTEI